MHHGKRCASQMKRGHGMIHIRRFNFDLLGKWIWCLGYQKQGLWKEVVDSKYGG